MTLSPDHPILAAFFNMSPGSLILIGFIVLLLFGSKKLPGLARSVGQSLNEFKKGKSDGLEEVDSAASEAKVPEEITASDRG